MRSKVLDLSSSDQGSRKVTQLVCDGEVIFNACEFIEWDDEHSQVWLCEACLVAGCGGGGRVIFRRAADKVLMMPAMAAQSKGEWERVEYAPPRVLERKGAICFASSQWSVVQSHCPEAPTLAALLPLTAPELAMLYHFQAPKAFLPDSLKSSEAKWEIIIAENGLGVPSNIDFLKGLFQPPQTYRSYDLIVPSPESYAVSVFLDTPDIQEWIVFSAGNEKLGYLNEDLHFRISQKE